MGVDVAIIDSGGANIASLEFALERLGCSSTLTRDAATIRTAKRVLLPGVGAARDAMHRLSSAGLTDIIRNLTQPVLGICLGMQLMAERSEEDDVECLGIFPGTAERLSADTAYPVPNMGWCPLTDVRDHALLDGIADGDYFYFVHSYALPVSDATLARAAHRDAFSAVVARDNFMAAQFHPERSADRGARLLENFVRTGV